MSAAASGGPRGFLLSQSIEVAADGAGVTISLGDWPRGLRAALQGYFTVDGDVLRLDLSHLTASPHDREASTFRSAQARLTGGLEAAGEHGRLHLFFEIVETQNPSLQGSASLHNAAGFAESHGRWPAYLADHWRDFREELIAEASLASEWGRRLLRRPARAEVLQQRDILEALIARVTPETFWSALSELAPGHSEDGWAFGKLADEHPQEVEAFLAANVDRALTYRREDPVHLVGALFEHCESVQQSRRACELALAKADPTRLAGYLSCTRQLTGDDVRRLLRRIRSGSDDEAKALQPGLQAAFETLARLSRAPLPSDLVLAGLWRDIDFEMVAVPTPGQEQTFVSLSELPSGSWNRQTLWPELGPDARQAWRAGLHDHVAGDVELAHGLLDFACRWLDPTAFPEIEPVLQRLIDSDEDLSFVRDLAARGPRLVELRATGLIRAKLGLVPFGAGDTDPSDPGLPDVGATTWIGDPSVEQIIHQLISRVEGAFCAEYPHQWGEDEEVLTRELLANAAQAAQQVMQQLRHRAHLTRGKHPSLSINVRQPGKAEEGSATHTGAPLAADILFLTRILDRGNVLVERATLVQVKKRRGDASGGRFAPSIPIDLQQCHDLLSQTEHAFSPGPDAARPRASALGRSRRPWSATSPSCRIADPRYPRRRPGTRAARLPTSSSITSSASGPETSDPRLFRSLRAILRAVARRATSWRSSSSGRETDMSDERDPLLPPRLVLTPDQPGRMNVALQPAWRASYAAVPNLAATPDRPSAKLLSFDTALGAMAIFPLRMRGRGPASCGRSTRRSPSSSSRVRPSPSRRRRRRSASLRGGGCSHGASSDPFHG